MRGNIYLLLAAILLPIALLTGEAWTSHGKKYHGETLVLPIQGFDPRDLLKGHYLQFRIDYGLKSDTGCPASDISASLCLAPEVRVYPEDELPPACQRFIRGNCDGSERFLTGLERFYIPETDAKELENLIRQPDTGELVISLNPQGEARIRDLLINGRPWREALQQPAHR
ncbi:MAG: GDYXXLXY domain-containing protein [Thiothrix sp.]|nr:GDYXXLXY domain-containing protein [Thiothrix sp.]HPE59141.1 GDYXXLXY domain-containing protein [Thiolinea sp.]